MNAATGAVIWISEIGPPRQSAQPVDYYNYSSPTLSIIHFYFGLASNCDNPLIRGVVV